MIGTLIDEMNKGNLPDAPIALITCSRKKIPNPVNTPPESLKTRFDWFLFGEIENILKGDDVNN